MMIEAIVGIAFLLLLYKAVMYWMRSELNSLKAHNRELAKSLKEEESEEDS